HAFARPIPLVHHQFATPVHGQRLTGRTGGDYSYAGRPANRGAKTKSCCSLPFARRGTAPFAGRSTKERKLAQEPPSGWRSGLGLGFDQQSCVLVQSIEMLIDENRRLAASRAGQAAW